MKPPTPSRSLKDLIYREYLKAALIPMLIIEIMLLIMYFSITGYIQYKTKETLLRDAHGEITDITEREVKNIDQQIESITNLAVILKKENSRLFANPQCNDLPAGAPLFATAANGVFYKKSDNGGSSVFYSNRTAIGAGERAKAIKTEAFDPLFKAIFESNPSMVGIYFNSFDSMCRYYPFLPDVYTVFPADMNIPEYNFYYLADRKHNPKGGPVWTDAYLDPAGKGWMASCIVPIYNPAGKLEGVTGIDITIDKIISNILNLKIPWSAAAFLVDHEGVILAMPKSVEDILSLKEVKSSKPQLVMQDTFKPSDYNLLKGSNPEIASQIKRIFSNGSAISLITIKGKKYFLTQKVIERTGWRMLILVKQDAIYAPIYRLDRLAKTIGLWAFIFMMLFYMAFFSYLLVKSKLIATRISTPLTELSRKTSVMKTNLKEPIEDEATAGITEVDQLISNFKDMRIDLRDFYAELENKVDERTQELSSLNYELSAVNDNLRNTNIELESEINQRRQAQDQLKYKNSELGEAYDKLKYTQAQMVQQEKMASIGQLAAGVAHEVNNPLSFITSNLRTLAKYLTTINEYHAYEYDTLRRVAPVIEIEEIEIRRRNNRLDFIEIDSGDLVYEALEGAERVRKIVLDLTRVSGVDQAEQNFIDVNLNLESAINVLRGLIDGDITITTDFGAVPTCYGNVQQINQVFLNLIQNAAQAIKGHGEITIKTWSASGMVKVAVSDSGQGIAAADLNRIFDPFFTTKPVGQGTGLGLSIAYDIINKHGGNIIVATEEGSGTTFTVSLPAASLSQQDTPEA